jgi:hypothetical protein
VEGFERAVDDVRTGFPRDGYIEELAAPGPSLPAEPQAGAQVPSRATITIPLREYSALQAHLNTIRDYVLAAQQTPITREDMHDHLKALTVFDEKEGLQNLVLSETGGGK